MIEGKPIDRVLRIALVLFMVGAVLFLMRHAYNLHQREQEIAKLALQRTQQMLHVRLDAMFHEWSEDLLEEAAAISHADSISINRLTERWVPLMYSHWAILSIRLGDERGNELAVYRGDSSLYLVRSEEGSKEHVPMAALLDPQGVPDTAQVPWTWHKSYDPRERIWFSKALENEREEPVWTIRQFGDTAAKVVQVSYLLRGRSTDDPYRVILLDVDLSRSEQLDSRASALSEFGSMLLSGDGRQLFGGSRIKSGDMKEVSQQVRRAWTADRDLKNFSFEEGEHSYMALIEPYLLNGLTLHTCVILDSTPITAWTAADHRVEFTVAAMLVLLFILLTGLWWRGIQRTALVRRHLKQNQNQARKLDKVIGEREVLSREVHHRVKNNLQVVSSLLNLQAATLADGPVRDEFLRGKRRIDTIALVHHKLYGLADLRNVDLQVLFTQVIEALAEMHRPQSRTVSVSVDAGGIKSDQDTAIELGIILCELVTNAYQHAFPYATGGHVEVSARNVEGDLHRLVVHNNGVALPADHASGPGKLGLELVDALAGQLDGSFHVRVNGGVTFEVLFRMKRPTANTATTSEEGPADGDPL